jgi:hypothetical protein
MCSTAKTRYLPGSRRSCGNKAAVLFIIATAGGG